MCEQPANHLVFSRTVHMVRFVEQDVTSPAASILHSVGHQHENVLLPGSFMRHLPLFFTGCVALVIAGYITAH